ncbi:MAG: sulfite exporter TauE/SafE family protein [Thermotogaceae bacterium]|nr:sulfite exporter TauE/SafE family protein [Thermotogaceae bacterium]
MIKILFIFLSGIFAGWVNVLAGGGSFLTLPALTYSGLGIDIANGTNRLAILLQNIAAVYKFRKSGILEWKKAFKVALPILLGAVAGSSIVVSIPKDLLKRIVGFLLIGMFIFMVRNKDKLIKETRVHESKLIRFLASFGTGLYGGFIQAGVGFFLIYTFTNIEGMDIVKANAYKVFSALLYTIFIIPIFIISRKFDFISGLILSAGNIIGAFISTGMAVKRGSKFVRLVVYAAMIASAVLFISGF